MKFDIDLYMVKALDMNDSPVSGYPTANVEINPYTLCRNTGIKINEAYLFENDLIDWVDTSGNHNYGVIVFDEWGMCFSVQTSLNYSGKRQIRQCGNINVIGNVVLSDFDFKKWQDWSDAEDKKYAGIMPPSKSASGDRWSAKCHKEAIRGAGIK